MTKEQLEEFRKARSYAKYTYTVSKLNKELTLLVNAILLNEIHETVTFRNPASLLRSIRAYKKHKNLYRPDLLPKGWESRPHTLGLSEAQILNPSLAMRTLLPLMKRDFGNLEKALWKDINRVHVEQTAQTGIVNGSKAGNWEMTVSEQQAKYSWRRGGRRY